MEIILTVLITLWIISATMLAICLKGGKLYVRIFEPKMWKNWEKVISSFDTVQFEESFNYPELAGLDFKITVDGKDANLLDKISRRCSTFSSLSGRWYSYPI